MSQTFRGKSFEITVLGDTMHPGFAVYTFDTEEKEFREQYWNIQEGDVVFDVGAAYGSYTLAALVSGAERVFAFEPEPKIYPNLVENVKMNGWSSRCDVLEYGLWNERAEIDIKSYAPHYATQSTAPTYKMLKLDAFISQCDKVDWLKIDVEGAEENVVAGGMEFINKFKPNLIIECDDFIDAGIIERISEKLKDYNLERVPRGECTFLVGEAK